MKTLFNIVGFGSYILIVFLNAMTDLGHKIILQNTIFKSFDGSELIILTAIINALILLPFILLFLPAGYVSDKYPKTKVIKVASFVAIVITLLILISYYNGWFWVAFGLTLVLSAQSAIYSPAKYGLIKELAGQDKLAIANGLVQSITIISILLGSVIYSIFFETLLDNSASNPSDILMVIYPLGYLLVGASILEFILSIKLSNQHKEMEIKDEITKPKLSSNIKLITQNRTIWLSIIGLSILWGVSQVLLAIFGEYLKTNFNITNTIVAQGMLTISGLGMVIGSLIAGKISKNYIETGSIPLGALGVALSLLSISLSNNLYFTSIALFSFGFFAGIFLVPLNSMIQFSAKDEDLGKVLAGNNFIQNIVMFVFLIITALFGYLQLSSQILLYSISLIAFLGMGYTFIKLPQSMIRYIIASIIGIKYSVKVDGLDNINPNKGTLLLGNHISFLDWAIIQIAYPSQIRFVMDRGYYEKWYLKAFFDFFRVIPISQKGSKEALKEVTNALNSGDMVALFPEGAISKDGEIGKFRRGFEIALRGVESDIDIIPFYIDGLWGDRFSKAPIKIKGSKDVSIIFGEAMSKDSRADEVRERVLRLVN